MILGPPGSGKGTQAQKISQRYQIPHISTGDILRENIENNTVLGQEAKEYMNKGELVPDELIIQMMDDRLHHDDVQNAGYGYLLDGFPRTIEQAEALRGLNVKNKGELDYVINLEVPFDILVQRISGRRICPKCKATYHIKHNKPIKEGICDFGKTSLLQRDDDCEETVKNRISVYQKNSEPLISYYQKLGKVVNINGLQDLDNVFADIVKSLDRDGQ